MDTIIRNMTDGNGETTGFRVTDNDDHLASCVASLSRNNTFVPGISRVLYNNPVTKVWFNDGTSVTIKTSRSDTFDKEIGLCYAIIKRVMGKPDGQGEIQSDGYMNRLKRIINLAHDQQKNDDAPEGKSAEDRMYDAVKDAQDGMFEGKDVRDNERSERKRLKRESMERARINKAKERKPSLAKTVEDLAKTVKTLETVVASLVRQ